MRSVAAAALTLLLAGCGSATRLAVAPSLQHAAASDSLLITEVTLVDPDSGQLRPAMDVEVRGDTIHAVRPAGSSPRPAAQRIDGRETFLIPGLWDMHVHVADAGYLDQFVANGVLGIRDMGGGLESAGDGCESLRLDFLQALRTEVDRGARTGPDMVLAGPALSGTGWPTSLPARSPSEAVASLDTLALQGADFAKVYEGIPLPAYLALAAHANARQLPFAGHVPEFVDLPTAIGAGQRSIEHLRDPMLMCFTDDPAELQRFFTEDGWGEADRAWGLAAHAACPAIIDALRARRTWLTPTLVVEKSKFNVDDPAFSVDPRRDALPASVQEGVLEYVRSKRAQSPVDRLSDRRWWRTQQALVGRLARAGVPVLAGTDAACEGGLPGYSLHDELAELVAAGLSPRQALQAATSEPARYLGRAQEGRIAPGMRANLLLLAANPLDDIRNTRSIVHVILRGRVVDLAAVSPVRISNKKGRKRKGVRMERPGFHRHVSWKDKGQSARSGGPFETRP
jgi:imidazolonepropionase-like amidohydrolase